MLPRARLTGSLRFHIEHVLSKVIELRFVKLRRELCFGHDLHVIQGRAQTRDDSIELHPQGHGPL